MTLPYDFDLWEMRYLNHDATFPTGFTAGNHATWDTATKLRFQDLDFSELKQASIPDPSVQDRFMGRPHPISTLRGGREQMALKFKMWLPGGSNTTSAEETVKLMEMVMGGLKSPTAITDAAEAGCSVTNIKATGHGQVVGQGSLYGVLADGYADGKFGVMKTRTDADQYDLFMALPGIPQAADAIKNGHTLYVDWENESYQSFLLIGSYPGSGVADDSVCMNIIGCSGTLAFGGLVAAEKPWVEFTFLVGDWRWEPYATTGAFTKTTDPEGEDPAGDRGIGSLTLQDAGTTTRATVPGGDLEVNLNMELVPIIDPQGVNGIGGWKKVRAENGATIACTAYWDDMPGRRNDFTAGTDKQVAFVCGHAAEATVAFEMQKARLLEDPTAIEYERMLGQRLMFEGDSGDATDESTADFKLQDAPIRVHVL